MHKHNIIIAMRGRNKYLQVCLQSLKEAYDNSTVDLEVYVVTDNPSDTKVLLGNLPARILTCFNEGAFNKSSLLNHGLQEMREDYDFVSIVDLDMIYSPNFFNTLYPYKSVKSFYGVSNGLKLIEEYSQSILDTNPIAAYENVGGSNFRAIDSSLVQENKRKLYPSQITLTKDSYNLILKVIDVPDLYDENFLGWGAEDSYVSFIKTTMSRNGMLNEVDLGDQWYHLYHPRVCDALDFDKEQYDKNLGRLEFNKSRIIDKVSNYAT